MNRSQKINLLTKIIEGANSQPARLRLQQIIDNTPRSLVILDDLDNPEKGFQDEDRINFTYRDSQHQMSLQEAHQFAKRNRIHTLFILPAKVN